MKKLVVLSSAALLAFGLFAGVALAKGAGPWPPGLPVHGHLMLIGVEFAPTGDIDPTTGWPIVEVSYDRCVELANGDPLSTTAHHRTVHRGTAGEALFEAGNVVIPLAPFGPFAGCEEVPPSPFQIPVPPEA